MEKNVISNSNQLAERIVWLKDKKLSQSIKLKNSWDGFVETNNPINVVKGSLHELAKDKGVKADLMNVGMNMGSNFLITKLFSGNDGKNGFFNSTMIRSISAALIVKFAPKLISKFVNKPKHESEELIS